MPPSETEIALLELKEMISFSDEVFLNRVIHLTGQSHTAPCWWGCAVCCQNGLDFKFCNLDKYEAIIVVLLVEEGETHHICHTDVPAGFISYCNWDSNTRWRAGEPGWVIRHLVVCSECDRKPEPVSLSSGLMNPRLQKTFHTHLWICHSRSAAKVTSNKTDNKESRWAETWPHVCILSALCKTLRLSSW